MGQRRSALSQLSSLLRQSPEKRIAVSRRQALNAGVTDRALGALVHAGALRRPYRGVYQPLGADKQYAHRVQAAIAAIAASGHVAVASHRTAAHLQGLVDRPPDAVHLTAAINHGTARKGIVLHRTVKLGAVLRFQGTPCTAPLRTLVDVAATASPSEVDEALDRALAAGIVRLRDLADPAFVSRRRGAAKLRASVVCRGLLGGPAPSVLESRMARLLTAAGLPVPRAEVIAGPEGRYRIDYAYEDVLLALETYGFAFHRSPAELARDLARQRSLTVTGGWTVLAFTWHDVTARPSEVAADIGAAYRRLAQAQRRAG